MKDEERKESIRRLLAERRAAPPTAAEIAAAIGLRGKEKKQLQHWLTEMERDGEIVRIRENRYAFGAEADLVAGRLSLARSGNGFVSGTGAAAGLEVFVPNEELGTALPGDQVLVRLDAPGALPARPGAVLRRTGRVIRILERSRREIVGTLKSTGRFLYVAPVDPSYQQDFYVPSAAGANLNDRVVVRFTGWENRHVSPEAEIVEVLGPADDPSLDTLAIVRHYGFRREFSAAVLAEAERAVERMERPGPREDLRAAYILTIDPARARDFDDALSLTADAAGRRVLGVHIADVSHFVRPGSALDEEARERGNSVYFPDAVLPMLPEALSNGVCSLRPNEDRLAFSVFLTVDERGQVVARRFARSLIRSRLRLTYEQALAAIEGREPAMPEAACRLLGELHALARQFRARRFARWALDLDMPESEVVLGPDGRMTGIRVVETDAAHQLVEECMVAANEAVALELAEAGLPLISRLHEPPDPLKIEELTLNLIALGYRPGDLNKQRHLAEFLRSIQDDPLAHHVRVAVLRSLKRAVYSAEAAGHYGLAKAHYAHFTSPIRRYPDLTVHRQLAARLGGGSAAGGGRLPGKSELSAVARHCTDTEYAADEAERALIEIKTYRFLAEEVEQQRPVTHEAVVVGVTNFGMFVELCDLRVQGLVHISGISDQFVRFDKQGQTLSAGKQTYKVGRRLRVRVTAVDVEKRRIDLALA